MVNQNHQKSSKNKGNKRVIAILCSLALILGLTACSPMKFLDKGSNAIQEIVETGEEKIEEAVDKDEDAEEDDWYETETDEVPEESEKADASDHDQADDDEEEYWKVLYVRTLDILREDIPGPDDDYEASSYTPCEYYLYDIDKDGIPELILKRGTCEADYNGEIYKNDGYAVRTAVYEVGMGHMGLYSDPGENGILFNWGHMGSHALERARLKKLDWSYELETEELLSEFIEGDGEYTEVEDVVPGAMFLPWSQMYSNLLVTHYEEVMAGMEGNPVIAKHDDSFDQTIKDAVEDTIDHGGSVVAVSGDGYGENYGTIPFDELLQKIDPWNDSPSVIDSQEYVDVNGDGKNDCVLFIKPKKPQSGDENHKDLCVLSLQDGKMYAYIVNYMYHCHVEKDGTFKVEDDEYPYNFRLTFEGEDCLMYRMSAN